MIPNSVLLITEMKINTSCFVEILLKSHSKPIPGNLSLSYRS